MGGAIDTYGGMRRPSRSKMKHPAAPKKAVANPGAASGDVVIDVIVAYSKKAASYPRHSDCRQSW